MRALLQRVASARVGVAGELCGSIGPGMVVLLGIAHGDDDGDIDWLVRKLVAMRIFADAAGVMNHALTDTGGDLLVVSQFTLYASTRKGNRPSYSDAAPPAIAAPLFERFVMAATLALGKPVPTGRFGADMTVDLVNDGPVTIMVDSRLRE